MNNVADLHIHTTFSDGVKTPQEIVSKAKQSGLTAIAISDHDAFGGIEPAMKASNGSLEIIPAVELSTKIDGLDIHILGYFVDYEDSRLVEEVVTFRKARGTRAEKIVQNLKKMGVRLDFSDVQLQAGEGAIGRPHIARALLDAGYIENQSEAFEHYLHYKSPAYVPKYKIHPIEAFQLILEAGGIPVWAHPGGARSDYLIQDFVKNGLMGIEIHHPTHGDRNIKIYEEIAAEYNLLITGGTDFHGRDDDYELGEYGIDEENYERLLEAHERMRMRAF
jgi:hypothetical protein